MITIHQGDCLQVLQTLPDESVHCCVTSPPYWGLRDYGVDGQIGLEPTPQAYVEKLVAVFREVKRVLRNDGTLWLNLGDSYAATTKGTGGTGKSTLGAASGGNAISEEGILRSQKRQSMNPIRLDIGDIKPKDLVGIPWMVAFALRADGWYLRQDIIWHKPNPMPESVTDRCTKAHEYIFLLSKSERYFYDAEAIKEPLVCPNETRRPLGSKGAWNMDGREQRQNGGGASYNGYPTARNKRSVWTVATSPYPGAHFATYPPDLIRPCIMAGCPVGGTVLDPFGGSGTTGQVALELGRKAVLIELNPKYVELMEQRTNVTPGLALA